MEYIKKIEDLKLIKVDKAYSKLKSTKYYYNLYLEGIDEPLLIDSLSSTLPKNLIGKEIKYILNDENIVEYLEII